MLTEQELNKIFNWLPYRKDWVVDRNQNDDGVKAYYGELIAQFNQNKIFNSYLSQDGGMSNYLEFVCYPIGSKYYSGAAILVLISLCAPVAAYGQTICTFSDEFKGNGFFGALEAGSILSPELIDIETEIKKILTSHTIAILSKEFLSKPLLKEMANRIDCSMGDQYLDGIFQRAD